MKKHLGLLICLAVIITPALANTVKENNYSEELNTTSVYDYVTKRIPVNIEDDIPNIDPATNLNQYIAVRQKKIADLQKKQEYYIKYFALKVQETNTSLQRARAKNANSSVIALHERWLAEYADQRNQTVGTLQAYIDRLQSDIMNAQAAVQQ